MSQSGKKGVRRFLPLLALAFVLLLAAAFVLLLPAIQAWFPAKSAQSSVREPSYQTVDARDADTLQALTVSHLGGDTYTLDNQGGILTLMADTGEALTVDQTLSDTFIKYASTIYIDDTVAVDESEVAEYLPAMGLLPAQITVTSVFTDGSVITIELGYAVADTSYHYYRWSGDNAVYLCSAGVYETFEYTADMLKSVTQPPIVASLIERVSIRHGDGEPIVCTFEADTGGGVLGTLQTPFHYPMDADAADALITAVENFRLGTRLKPVTDETRAGYGLDTPQAVVIITQHEGLYSQVSSDGVLQSLPVEPASITLTIGDAEGEFFYFCEYGGTCYRVSRFLITAFLKADAMNYVSVNPADMGEGNILGITIQTGSGTLNIRAAYLETVLPNNELETDEYGNIVYTTEVTANGDPVTAAAFEALLDRLRQMTVSGKLSGVTEPDGAPRWQMTLTAATGKARTLSAYPMDAFHDILAVDGTAVHYISNEALDIALGEFAALPEPTAVQ